MKRTTTLSILAILLAVLAGCGGTKGARTPADVRGDAFRPVDKRPPEGTLSAEAKPPERFTLRRPQGVRRDTVVRVDPPPRVVTAPDPAATSPPRTVTTTPAPPAPAATPSQAPSSPPAAAKGQPDPPVPSEQFLAQDPPQVITRVPPVSPPRAREARVGGTVLVKVLVGADGLVRATRIVRSIPELDSAAVACVKQWKFKPATSSGVAVAAWTDVPVRFLLQSLRRDATTRRGGDRVGRSSRHRAGRMSHYCDDTRRVSHSFRRCVAAEIGSRMRP